MSVTWWSYDAWPSVAARDWSPATRGDHVDDQLDFHVDLGCGTVKKGRIGVDRYAADGVNVVMNLDSMTVLGLPSEPGGPAHDVNQRCDECGCFGTHTGYCSRSSMRTGVLPRPGLPFPDSSIESIITHHCLEHIGDGFVALIDDCWRVLKPEGLFRIIVPLYPSTSAVEDPDHKRYFMEDTFASFLGARTGECWLSSFSVPYTKGRFLEEAKKCTALFPPEQRWTPDDRREMRLTLRAIK